MNAYEFTPFVDWDAVGESIKMEMHKKIDNAPEVPDMELCEKLHITKMGTLQKKSLPKEQCKKILEVLREWYRITPGETYHQENIEFVEGEGKTRIYPADREIFTTRKLFAKTMWPALFGREFTDNDNPEDCDNLVFDLSLSYKGSGFSGMAHMCTGRSCETESGLLWIGITGYIWYDMK